MRDLFISELREAEGRGNYRREVLELMLERTMDYCEVTHARLNDGFRAVQAGHGGFTRFYLSAMREFTQLTADRTSQQVETIDFRIRELAEMEVEPVPYRLAATNDEAKQLMVELANCADSLRRFRDSLTSYPDMVATIDVALRKVEGNSYFATAANLQTAGNHQRQRYA